MDRNEAIDTKHAIEAAMEKAGFDTPEALAFALTQETWQDTVKFFHKTINEAFGWEDMELNEEELSKYRIILAKQVLDDLGVDYAKT